MAAREVLRECPIFESLTDTQIGAIVGISKPRDFDPGASVFSEANNAEELFVLEKGKVALQMHLSVQQPQFSRRITVDIVNKGEPFGWSAVVEPHRYTLTAICLEPSKVLAIDGLRLKTLLHTDHQMGYEVLSRLINVVASRLDETRQVLISERLTSLQV